MTIAAIGIGSNLGDSIANVRAAIEALAELGDVTAMSSLYRSAPWGIQEQPDFVNAAVLLATELAPRDLLAGLKKIEERLGRTPTYRWGPRVIDLDILYYGDIEINDADLQIPHPHFLERPFVLVPLAEIDPDYRAKAQQLDTTSICAL